MRRFIFISSSIVIAVLATICATTLSLRPALPPPAAPSQSDYEALSHFVLSHATQLSNSEDTAFTIKLERNALEGGLRVLHKQHPMLRARTIWQPDTIDLHTSFHIGGRLWLNTKMVVRLAQHVEVESIQVGPFLLPRLLIQALLESGLTYFLKQSYQDTLANIDSVAYTPPILELALRHDTQIQKSLLTLIRANVMKMSSLRVATFDQQLDHYYRHFDALSRRLPFQKNAYSLAPYLNLVVNTGDQDRASAALIALALHTNTPSLTHLLAQTNTSQQSIPFTLWGRTDLAKHFLLSAAIKLLLGSETNLYVTQFKEMLDSDGGSGFSFKDIAANRAGAKFADFISKPSFVSRGPYQIVDEAAVLQRIPDLEEHIERDAFSLRFHSTESKEYQGVIEKIDKAIAESTLYRDGV